MLCVSYYRQIEVGGGQYGLDGENVSAELAEDVSRVICVEQADDVQSKVSL
jgi:hypothetical protein